MANNDSDADAQSDHPLTSISTYDAAQPFGNTTSGAPIEPVAPELASPPPMRALFDTSNRTPETAATPRTPGQLAPARLIHSPGGANAAA